MDPSRSGSSIVWRHPWPSDITAVILDKHPGGTLINSNLELAALVLDEVTIMDVCPDANAAMPHSRSDNN